MQIFNYDPRTGYFIGASEADLCPGTEALRRAAQARVVALAEERAANAAAREAHDAQARGLPEGAEPLADLELPFPAAETEADPVAPKQEHLLPAHATTIAPPAVTDPLFAARFDEKAQAWAVERIPPEPVPRPASVAELWASWHAHACDAAQELAAMYNVASMRAMQAQADGKKAALAAALKEGAEVLAMRTAILAAVDYKAQPEGDVEAADRAYEERFAAILKDASEEVRTACGVLL